ncbi:OLC1v1005498C1 [Oldenlandia corymbosa var. corymbosa]|uniref:OLC1v1005498C1 n=1 Tax=Oldenlandia corymbosa var. corymbosa TaxID=529605 RepID=A0AAV1DES0_OLDCO|nr:OLC1v1005498C1 [Oldenlandia corymbosa var. corymbosa]
MFDASLTKEHDFHLLNGNRIKAPFMTSHKKQYISAYDGFKVLRLPYCEGQENGRYFWMYFFLPDKMKELQALVEKLGSEPDFIDGHPARELVEVGDFRIPKFKILFDFDASKLLKDLGLVLPFSPGGFTNMVDSGGEDLEVEAIFHQSFIEVNEEDEMKKRLKEMEGEAAALCEMQAIFEEMGCAQGQLHLFFPCLLGFPSWLQS